MKIIAINREDTNILFQLLGIETYEIPEKIEPKEFEKEFEKILAQGDIGLILLNEKYLFRNRDYFKKLKIQKYPIIVEIPDMPNPLDDEYFFDAIQQFIGFRYGRIETGTTQK